MAAPTGVAVIGVKCDGATAGEYVIVRNLTRGGKLTGKLIGSDKSIEFNAAPTTAWQDGDVIQGEIRGRYQAVQQKTIRSGSAKITLTGSADTTTPGVSL